MIQHQRTNVNVPFTPSLLANPSPELGSGTASKRKRTNTQHISGSASTLVSGSANAIATTNNRQAAEVHQTIEKTPNPKPRKQVRHARMPSIESPTRPSFGATPRTGSSSETNGNNSGRKKALNLGKEVNRTPTKSKRVLVQSPHAKNPDADWISEVPAMALSVPPARRAVLSARGSRRSATPIPPYEPPPDVFTPPREVFLSPAVPTVSKSSKRKTPAAKKKGTRASTLRVVTVPQQVKLELPDHIDLSAPMPPPSPSDDPLLLSGPPEPESSPLRRLSMRHHREVSVQAEQDDILPPSSPEPPLNSEDAEALRTLDWHHDAQMVGDTSEMDDSMRLDPGDADVSPVRLFDFDGLHDVGNAGGWSDSDEEMGLKAVEGVEEGEGEYTGKWRMTKVRTKLDPPSSATRIRMDAWGRPISPFPKINKMDLLGEEDEESDGERETEQVSVQDDDEEEEEEVRRMSVEPEDCVDESTELPVLEPEEEDEEEREVRQMSVEFDNNDEEQQVLDLNIRNDSTLRQPSPVVDRRSSNIFAFPSLESPEAGPSSTSKDIPRSPSASASNNAFIDEDTQMRDPPVQGEDLLDDDEDDSSSDTSAEPGIVKITSADPRAAARAAAILKQVRFQFDTLNF